MARQPKVCAHCGRQIEDRKMSDHDWDKLIYCSSRCRRSRGGRVHRELEETIVALLRRRAPSATICPSEAARELFGEGFKNRMVETRNAARRLAHRRVILITQKGRPVDPGDIRGPVRLARGPDFPSYP